LHKFQIEQLAAMFFNNILSCHFPGIKILNMQDYLPEFLILPATLHLINGLLAKNGGPPMLVKNTLGNKKGFQPK